MEDIRMKLFWHPVHGELAKISADECTYENKDTIIHDTQIYVDEPMETIYERGRRAWVEEAMLKELVETDRQSNEDEVKLLTQYYYEAYDVIQKTISNFQTNK
jgi:hypothetical protein